MACPVLRPWGTPVGYELWLTADVYKIGAEAVVMGTRVSTKQPSQALPPFFSNNISHHQTVPRSNRSNSRRSPQGTPPQHDRRRTIHRQVSKALPSPIPIHAFLPLNHVHTLTQFQEPTSTTKSQTQHSGPPPSTAGLSRTSCTSTTRQVLPPLKRLWPGSRKPRRRGTSQGSSFGRKLRIVRSPSKKIYGKLTQTGQRHWRRSAQGETTCWRDRKRSERGGKGEDQAAACYVLGLAFLLWTRPTLLEKWRTTERMVLPCTTPPVEGPSTDC